MKTTFKTLTKIATTLSLGILLSAFTSDNSGKEIAKLSKESSSGWGTSSVTMTMTLTNRNGQKTIRKMHGYNMEVAQDGDKSMTIFDTPKDVKGTVSMTFSHRKSDDEQWLYLPAIQRVKRISSSNKSGPFMGSEFAFEDIGSIEIEKYTYNYIGEGEANGAKCEKVERFPTSKTSGYKRNVVYYNKDNRRIERIEFYDRKNTLLKTLVYSDYKLYDSTFWRADKLNMVNQQNGKETLLEFSDLKLGVELSEDDFSQNALKRVK